MARTPARVRDAVVEDAAALLVLWRDLVRRPAAEALLVDATDQVAASLVAADADPRARVLVAEVDGEVVGTAYLRFGQVSPLGGDTGVHLSHLQVDERFARHGVGQALTEAALTWAEHLGAGTLLVASLASDRESNRFFARRGFAQVAVLRVGAVGALRARVPHDPSDAARSTGSQRRAVGRVVAVRRSQRRARRGDATA